MLKLRIANFSDGISTQIIECSPSDLELGDLPEFETPVTITFTLTNLSHDIYVKAEIATDCNFLCDRCLGPFTANIRDTVRMIFSPSSELKSKEDDYVFPIKAGATELDVTIPLKETLVLSLPTKRICKDDCKGLCPRCGENLNENTCDCVEDVIDSRWEALRQLNRGKNGIT